MTTAGCEPDSPLSIVGVSWAPQVDLESSTRELPWEALATCGGKAALMRSYHVQSTEDVQVGFCPELLPGKLHRHRIPENELTFNGRVLGQRQ